MARPKKHRHSKELGLIYGYAHASGWKGVGACYYCKGCSEVLWFEDDISSIYLQERNWNEKKRKKNKRYDPHRKHKNKDIRRLSIFVNYVLN
jgi:hypothetical protein